MGEPFYQLLREKERLLREYKYKYETTKTLYDDLMDTLVQQKPLISSVKQLAEVISDVLGVFMGELDGLNLKKSTLHKVSLNLQAKFEDILSTFTGSRASSRRVTGSLGLIKVDSSVGNQFINSGSRNNSFPSNLDENYSQVQISPINSQQRKSNHTSNSKTTQSTTSGHTQRHPQTFEHGQQHSQNPISTEKINNPDNQIQSSARGRSQNNVSDGKSRGVIRIENDSTYKAYPR